MVFFSEKTCSDCCKNHGCGQKKKPLALLDLVFEGLEGKFHNLNFLPSTKMTTEYSFDLFLSIYRN